MLNKIIAMLLLLLLLLSACGKSAPTAPTAPADTAPSASEALSAPTEPPVTEPPATELTANAPSPDALRTQLDALPDLEHVCLTGILPELGSLIALKQDYPAIVFEWDFDFYGVPVNTLTEQIDISGTDIADLQEFEQLLSAFYNLKTIDMCRCGIPDEEMDALRHRHPDIRFIWEVQVCSLRVRTDATYFMPVKFDMYNHPNNDFSNLRYCTDLVVIDLGHYVVNDTTFVEYLPNLQYLQLCEATIDDLTSIGKCTSLRMLELFLNPATDFWPLTNLTNLQDLNISNTSCVARYAPRKYGTFGDVTPLTQMTWLDRLWVISFKITDEDIARLQQALPDTVIVAESGSSTDKGWRHCPNYYAARDIVDMWYMYI